MPTIPRIGPERARNQALPSGAVSANAPADAFGVDTSGASQVLNQYALKVKEQADTARVMEATSGLTSLSNSLLYDPEAGALNRRGKNALGADEDTLAEFNKRADALQEELAGDAQRQAFERIRAQRTQMLQSTLMRHVSSEMSTYEANQAEALVNASVESAAANYSDPSAIGLELRQQRGAILAQSKTLGWSPEQERQALEKATSATHGAVIERMLADQQYGLAQEYWEANGEAVEGKTYAQLKGLVEKGGKLATAQGTADRIMAEIEDEKDALKAARAIADPEVRESVVGRVSRRFEEQRAIEKREKAEALEAAVDVIEGGTAFDELPLMLQQKLDNKQLNALKARAQQLANPDIRNNWKIWTDISTADREQLAAIEDPYTMLRPHLDDAHYNKAVTLINKAKGLEQDAADAFEPSSSLTFQQRLRKTAELSGLVPADRTPAKWPETTAKTYARFQLEAAARIEEAARAKGKKLTGSEEQAVMDEMVLEKYQLDRGFFRPDQAQFGFALSEDDVGDAYVPLADIPEPQAAFIRNQLKANGLAPDQKRIEKAFAQYRLGNFDAYQNIISGR